MLEQGKRVTVKRRQTQSGGDRARSPAELGGRQQKRLEGAERCVQVAGGFWLLWPVFARRCMARTLVSGLQSFNPRRHAARQSCRPAASPHPAAPHAGGGAPSPRSRAGSVAGDGAVVSLASWAGGRWASRAAAGWPGAGGWGALVQVWVAAAGAGPDSVPGLPGLRRATCGERRLGSARRLRRGTSPAVLQGRRLPNDRELGQETATHCFLLLRSRMIPQHRSVPKSREPTIAAVLTRQCLRMAAPAEALAVLSPTAPGGTALGLSASSRCWAACGSSGSAETFALPLQPLREEAALLSAEGTAAMLPAPSMRLPLTDCSVPGFSWKKSNTPVWWASGSTAKSKRKGKPQHGLDTEDAEGEAPSGQVPHLQVRAAPWAQVAGGVPLGAVVLLWAPGDFGKLWDSGAVGSTLH